MFVLLGFEGYQAGREIQFLEIMETVLKNKVVQQFSNLTFYLRVQGIGKTPTTRKAHLGVKLLTLTHQSTCRDSIYKIRIGNTSSRELVRVDHCFRNYLVYKLLNNLLNYLICFYSNNQPFFKIERINKYRFFFS